MINWLRNTAVARVASTSLTVIIAVVALGGAQCRAAEETAGSPVTGRMARLAGTREPVSIQADKVEYDRKSRTYTATGNVTISQGGSALTADSVKLDELTGDAEAAGGARLVTGRNVLFAESLKVNFNTSLGVIEKGSLFIEQQNFHVTGESLERVSEEEYRVTGGGLTTCDADNPFWRVTADELDVRMDRDVRAKGVVMRLKGVPVFYTPYAWFPLLKPRTTGFLLPSMGYSSTEGFRFADNFYWAASDNLDLTIGADVRARRGVGASAELRYAHDKDTGTNARAYFLDDRKDKKERYNLSLKHQQVINDTLSGRVDVNLSDRQFYRDLTETARERTQRSIDSNVFATNRWDWGRAYLFGQYTLGLDQNNDVIVQRLPEAGVNVVKQRIGGTPLYFDMDAAGAYFHKKNGVSGGRLDLFPKVSGAFNIGGVNFSPRIGYRETVYSLSGNEKAGLDEERGLIGLGATLQTGFYRLFTFDEGLFEGVRHTVEPVLAYNYVARRGGTEFAKFDGVDTLGRRNLVSYSVVNRFVLKYRDGGETPRVDYLTVKLSQFHDMHGDHTLSGVKRAFSTLYGETVYKAGGFMTLNNDFRFDFYGGSFRSVNTDITFDDSEGRWSLTLGQRFSTDAEETFIAPSRFDFFTPTTDFMSDFVVASRQEGERLNFLTVDGSVRVSKYWQVAGRAWYDVHTETFRETGVSVTYSSQCWGFTTGYVNRPGERQVMFTINLKGLGNVKV
ncbi:MAG: LPS-assembly protein LptD [Nitrospirae bacterium]|nr:LPS-assembly protein LptD [Nitrospirota bacterium]